MILHDENDDLMYGNATSQSVGYGVVVSKKTYKVLSDTLYTHKIRAIIRELCCNAYDAHKLAGHTRQFEVQLPSVLDCRFIIRDFGPGLSDKDVKTIFTVYFASTKEDTNDFVGALGLGAKSPFSYGSRSFTVISRHGGLRTVYNMAWQNGEPACMTINSVPLAEGEDAGLEIVVPAEECDIEVWMREAKMLLRAFSGITPKIVSHDITIEPYPSDPEFTGAPGIVNALMGNIVYPVPEELYKDRLFHKLKRNMTFRFELGALDFAPSREQLSLNEETIKNINDRFDAFESVIVEDFQKAIDLCKTRRVLYEYVHSKSQAETNYIKEKMQWNGRKVGDVCNELADYNLFEGSYVFYRVGETPQTCRISKCKTVLRRRSRMNNKITAGNVFGPTVKKLHVLINDMPGYTVVVPTAMVEYKTYVMPVFKKGDAYHDMLLDKLRGMFDEDELVIINASDYKEAKKQRKVEARPKSPNVVFVNRKNGTTEELFLTASEVRSLEGIAVYTFNGNAVTKDQRDLPYIGYEILEKIKCEQYYRIRPAAYKYANESKLVAIEDVVNELIPAWLEEFNPEKMLDDTHLHSAMHIKLRKLADAGFMEMKQYESAEGFISLHKCFNAFANEENTERFTQCIKAINKNREEYATFRTEFASNNKIVNALLDTCYTIDLNDASIIEDIMKLKKD